MNNFLVLLSAALPFLAACVLAVLAVGMMGAGIVWPRLLAYGYVAMLFCTNSTSYGSLATTSSPGIYSRGSGQLFIPLLLWCMVGAWCCARDAAGFRQQPAPSCNLRPWFLGWFLLLAAHVAAAVWADVTLAQALAPSGFSNIVWMAPLVALMLQAFRTRAHGLELSRFILLAGLGRATFGLVRWIWLGGDPNNVYANMNAIDIRLTFFDINDSLLCTMACAIAAVYLFQVAGPRRARCWTARSATIWRTSTRACAVFACRSAAPTCSTR
jgi:hypothetical protein